MDLCDHIPARMTVGNPILNRADATSLLTIVEAAWCPCLSETPEWTWWAGPAEAALHVNAPPASLGPSSTLSVTTTTPNHINYNNCVNSNRNNYHSGGF